MEGMTIWSSFSTFRHEMIVGLFTKLRFRSIIYQWSFSCGSAEESWSWSVVQLHLRRVLCSETNRWDYKRGSYVTEADHIHARLWIWHISAFVRAHSCCEMTQTFIRLASWLIQIAAGLLLSTSLRLKPEKCVLLSLYYIHSLTLWTHSTGYTAMLWTLLLLHEWLGKIY